jgi:hypothetical protein
MRWRVVPDVRKATTQASQVGRLSPGCRRRMTAPQLAATTATGSPGEDQRLRGITMNWPQILVR